jgi:hypothetical protein
LAFGDRVQVESIHLPTALALGKDLAPRSGLGRRLAGLNLLGSGVHPLTAFRVPSRIAGGDPPAVNEVVQHTEIKVHSDLIENCLEPGIERLSVLVHHQSGPDGTEALGRIRQPTRDKVMRLRNHAGLLSLQYSLQRQADTGR